MSDKSKKTYTVRPEIEAKLTGQDIDDIMVCALEGGITGWCCEAEVVGEYLGEFASDQISRGGKLILHDAESDDKWELDLDAQRHEEESKAMYREWLSLPDEKLIPATSSARPGVHGEMRRGFRKVWEKAIHRCHGLPPGAEIWMNEIEPPEFWVLNHGDNPCGEQVEVCPYCGAHLKSGEGDVVLIKDDGALWAILGYMKEEE